MSLAGIDDEQARHALGPAYETLGFGRCPRCGLADVWLYGPGRVCSDCRQAAVNRAFAALLHRASPYRREA